MSGTPPPPLSPPPLTDADADVAARSAPPGAARAARLMRHATYASVAVAVILVLAKVVAWKLTDSVSLLSSLVDSLLDGVASVITLVAVRQALAPADAEHRFGHGKAEALAAVGQSAFIAGSALFVLIEAGTRLAVPQPVAAGWIGIAVMALSIAATLGLVTVQHYVIRQTRSVAIRADSLHYTGDLLMNASVIVALVLATETGWLWADPVFGLAIGLFILWTAAGIVRTALNDLMDRELPDADRRRIADLALEDDRVLALHDLRTRSAGPNTFIQLHLEMDGGLTLRDAHAIADAADRRIGRAFPDAEVLIHQDPVSHQPDRVPDRLTRAAAPTDAGPAGTSTA